MQTADVTLLTHQVLAAAFALAVVYGALAQASHFCTMGAIADVVSMGNWSRARMWIMAIGVAAIGFGLMSALGVIDPKAALYTSPRIYWASLSVGGLLFGAGMVLASGCGGKTLVRIGGGNLKSLVVLVVMGVAAAATLRGMTAVVRTNTVDQWVATLPTGQDLPSLLAAATGLRRPLASLALGLSIGVALCLLVWRQERGERRAVIWGGVGMGMVVAAMWWISGHLGFIAESPDTLEPAYLGGAGHGMEALSFVTPAAQVLNWLILFSDSNTILSFGVVIPFGVVLGSTAAAVWAGRFRWEGFAGAHDTAQHLVGALLMGVGGVTALGCSVGHGLSGLSTLSLGSLLATASIVAGAVAALRWQIWRMDRP